MQYLMEVVAMTSIHEADDLPRRLQNGESSAKREIFERYAARLSRLAERHLAQALKRRVDGEDIVQSVFLTFFKRSARGEFQIDSESQLWKLLVQITIRRVHRRARFHQAGQRNVCSEQASSEDAEFAEFAAREPDPAFAAEFVDQIEKLLQGLPESYCQILNWRLQGFSAVEIAEKLKISRRSVYRATDLLQKRLNAHISTEHD